MTDIYGSALICDNISKTRNFISSALQEQKYKVDFSTSSNETFEKLRFNQYDVIILKEDFDENQKNNEVLKHFQNMPMSVRRHIFLVLIGENFKTMDNMTAFSKSVDLVINKKDLPDLTDILKKSIADHDQFYMVYKEILRKLGKR